MPPFRLDAAYSPTADQPKAIARLAEGLTAGERMVTLLGATGTGKTMTMAATIEAIQRPTLVLAHNKTLAAQLCNEFRTYFPDNAVEYFVSYYDYYQPEAYVPSRDLYIEKDSAINQEVDRLRHAATASLFARRDVVIVASVSCIFGLGSPETYDANCQVLVKGHDVDRDELLRKLVSLQYNRNDTALGRGTFRVRGETLEVFPAYEETAFRVLLFGDEVERLQHFDPLTGELIRDDLEHVAIWPATHYNVVEGRLEEAVAEIGRELNERCAELEAEGKLLESHRLRQRTQYDMEMLREMGFCNGIENYSRILDGRPPGARPYCLIDYFPDDFLCFIDESHQTVPQIGGMYEGDRPRKSTLVDYGFRLPSALDNRPQTFDEFMSITPQLLFVSATPGEFERTHSSAVVEQIVRPTGIVDPIVEVRETRNQIDDLMNEIRIRVDGTVLMYADKETAAMRAAISETDRRRAIQLAYNEEHGITAATIVKGISDIAEFLQSESKVPDKSRRRRRAGKAAAEAMSLSELEETIVELEEEMLAAAEELRFEYAARVRDEIRDLRRELTTAQANEAPA